MAKSWQDDLDALERDAHGDRPRPIHVKRRARMVGAVVEAATARAGDDRPVTAVRCVAHVGDRACGDAIHVARDRDGTIAWSCPGCGENGFVTGFAGGPRDLTGYRPDPERPRAAWAPSDDELALLDDASEGLPEVRATLARASAEVTGGVSILATEPELERLYAFAASLADTSLAANRGDLLSELAASLGAALDRVRAEPRRR